MWEDYEGKGVLVVGEGEMKGWVEGGIRGVGVEEVGRVGVMKNGEVEGYEVRGE